MLRTKYSEEIEKQMKAYFDTLNEKDRRGYAAIEAMKLGHGGQNYISSVLGCHFQTVMAGINEITNGTETPENRIRKLRTRHIINSAHLLLYVLIFTIKVANRNSNN